MFNGALARLIDRQHFCPTAIGLLVNPFYFARRGLHQQMQVARGYLRGRVLDVGCGQKPYRDVIQPAEYIGLELDTPENRRSARADVFYDGRTLPFPAESFDCVMSNQVLEHVFEPGPFLSEIWRVIKPDGLLVLTVPFVWDEHEQPRDFARYSSFGIRHLLETARFSVIRADKSTSDVRVIFQLANAYCFKINPFQSARARLAFSLATTAPINLAGELCGRILPPNADLYLDNFVVAKKRG